MKAYLLHECAKFSKFFQNWLMGNSSNILDMIKGLALLVAWSAAFRLSRINSLQDAKATEVFDCNLQHFQAFRAANKCRFQASVVLLLSFSHSRQLSLGAHLRMACSLDGLLLLASFHSISHLLTRSSRKKVNSDTKVQPVSTAKCCFGME